MNCPFYASLSCLRERSPSVHSFAEYLSFITFSIKSEMVNEKWYRYIRLCGTIELFYSGEPTVFHTMSVVIFTIATDSLKQMKDQSISVNIFIQWDYNWYSLFSSKKTFLIHEKVLEHTMGAFLNAVNLFKHSRRSKEYNNLYFINFVKRGKTQLMEE